MFLYFGKLKRTSSDDAMCRYFSNFSHLTIIFIGRFVVTLGEIRCLTSGSMSDFPVYERFNLLSFPCVFLDYHLKEGSYSTQFTHVFISSIKVQLTPKNVFSLYQLYVRYIVE